MVQQEKYMQRCIELALKGAGSVAPNPMVGSVLVYKDRIIGEGYHVIYGGPHAEVNCINSVSLDNKAYVKDATLYVSLEPCAHYGKTPPCAVLIVKNQIKHVVIGSTDPFDSVNGKGIHILKEAGIKVEIGILELECKQINASFFTYHQKKRPYIILKWAQTADTKIASASNERLFITNSISNTLVHQWRSEVAAILVGTNTALKDNPKLNNRFWTGKSPIRLVIDLSLRLPTHLHLFSDGQPTIVFNYKKSERIGAVKYEQVLSNQSVLAQIIEFCYLQNYQSILVEGGASILQSFIDESLWDEARVLTNHSLSIRNGIDSPLLTQFRVESNKKLLDDEIVIYLNK
ncbi:MAG: bifunctional diaminohydroxyphosphoribosylaminopyrimidine deaminase/5-amino-6-(5-phosphoribosylamino)uracil reductase RibD [Sphingobacteriia bacterium]